ncbi:MAG TPA: hypothetical protein VMS99_02265 [Acidimicrobiia bacterium]|nr:hypothetical protein [Acidimicrobiia bacterium]
MTNRLLSLTAALMLIVGACGGTTEGTTTIGSDTTTTTQTETTVAAVTPQGVLLSYSLTAGDEFSYEVDLDQHIEVSASGDASLMGDEEMPGNAVVDLTGSATFTHVVSDGPEAGTYEIHITGDFADVTVTGTVDGEPVDSDEAPDFAALDPIDLTIVVDEQGKLIQKESDIDDPLGGLFGDLGALGGSSPAPGLDPGQFFGPLLSDDEVTVGDTWSEDIETSGLSEDNSIVTSITSTVTDVENLDGTEVFVIESQSSTSRIEFDLGEFFAGMLGAFLPEGTTEAESAEFEEMLAQLKFLMTIDDTTSDSTTWFDAEAGIARQSEVTAGTRITMELNMPDEDTGEMVGFDMDMALDQVITYRLISGPPA